MVESWHHASPYSIFWDIFGLTGANIILVNSYTVSWSDHLASNSYQILQAFIFHIDGLNSKVTCPNSFRPPTFEIKACCPTRPLSNLSLTLLSTCCLYLGYAPSWLQCTSFKWCTIFLGHIISPVGHRFHFPLCLICTWGSQPTLFIVRLWPYATTYSVKHS